MPTKVLRVGVDLLGVIKEESPLVTLGGLTGLLRFELGEVGTVFVVLEIMGVSNIGVDLLGV